MPRLTVTITADYSRDLKKRLEQYGITPAELSRETGIYPTQFSRWFASGQIPRMGNVMKIEEGIIAIRKRRQKEGGKQ